MILASDARKIRNDASAAMYKSAILRLSETIQRIDQRIHATASVGDLQCRFYLPIDGDRLFADHDTLLTLYRERGYTTARQGDDLLIMWGYVNGN